jgi:hypothetical protein
MRGVATTSNARCVAYEPRRRHDHYGAFVTMASTTASDVMPKKYGGRETGFDFRHIIGGLRRSRCYCSWKRAPEPRIIFRNPHRDDCVSLQRYAATRAVLYGKVSHMNANNIFDVMGGIVLVALVTTIVTSRNTASQITAVGNAFSGSIQAALGRGAINR